MASSVGHFRYETVSYRFLLPFFLLRLYPQEALWLSLARGATMGGGPGTP